MFCNHDWNLVTTAVNHCIRQDFIPWVFFKRKLKTSSNWFETTKDSFNHFDNITLLKSGGFGVVFRGRHQLDNIYYTIKLIPVRVLLNFSFKTAILSKIREIRYLAKFNHPNIIRYHNSWLELDSNNTLAEYIAINDIDIYDSSCSLGDLTSDEETSDHDKQLLSRATPGNWKYIYLSIQMELMEYTLKDWYATVSPVNYELYPVLYGILDGLEYLHNSSPPMIHCDIKPGNILVKKEHGKWIAKLADFGLVTEADGKWKPNKYEGTLTYRAPEMEDDQLDATTAVDIYSLGVVLYELTLQYKTDMERLMMINKFKTGENKTNTILDTMISKNPDHRPAINKVKEYLIKSYS